MPQSLTSIRELAPYWPLFRKEWIGWATVAVTGVVSVALKLPMPLLTAYVIDHVLLAGRLRALDVIFGVLVVLTIVNIGVGYLTEYALLRVQKDLTRRLSLQLLEKVQAAPLSHFSGVDAGYLQSRILAEPAHLNTLILTLFNIVINTVTLATGLAATIFINPRLAILSIALLPCFGLSLRAFRRPLESLDYAIKEQQAVTAGGLTESLRSRELTKLYSLGRRNCRRLNKALLADLRLAISYLRCHYLMTGSAGFFAALGPLVVVWYGGRETIAGRLTIGQLVAFSALLGFLYGPTQSLLGSQIALRKSLVSLRRIGEILAAPVESSLSSGRRVRLPNAFGVFFSDVAFHYEADRRVLNGVTFRVPEGSTTAIVGPIGSGKSTLVKLLVRCYAPSAGKILLDDVDVADIAPDVLRSYVGVIPQEPFLFDCSVYDNVRLGRPGASRHEVTEAVRKASAYDFVMSLPQQLDTRVGPSGATLSGGQKQLLCIARAILKDPRVLVMDEPTSSVDARSETLVRAALAALKRDRTTIVISHRLSAVSFADQYVVLESGTVVASGTEREVLGGSAFFREMAHEQGARAWIS